MAVRKEPKQNDYVTIDEYLDGVNAGLLAMHARIIGEVTEIQLYPGRSYLFFKIKDKDAQASMSCFMWQRDYAVSGVKLEEGLEVILSGAPNIYKPAGRLSFHTKTVELVGEGALKKAYDELKVRLEKEGMFAQSRKRALPEFPQKIGLITSKDGAAIGDFQMNLGRFGYKVTMVDSRVEGQLAVAELISAIRTLRTKDIEILVLVRGGGSLESLLPFNNEALVREIVDFPVPVLVGVGHERDISLVALAADMMVSTPTATAEALNDSWQAASMKVVLHEQRMVALFSHALLSQKQSIDRSFRTMQRNLESIFESFRRAEQSLVRVSGSLRSRIAELGRHLDTAPTVLIRAMHALIKHTHESIAFDATIRAFAGALQVASRHVASSEKLLESNSPERQLRLGYSIVRTGTDVVRSVSQLNVGDDLEIRVLDGTFDADITRIKNTI
jgi:exodeoxyribonuclease VII large subunit